MFQMKQLTLNESQASIVSKRLQQTKSVTRATQTGVCLQWYGHLVHAILFSLLAFIFGLMNQCILFMSIEGPSV